MSAIETEVFETQDSSPRRTPSRIEGAVIGVLVGFRDDGKIPLVTFPGQRGTAALDALTTVDLHGAHVGHSVVLLCEAGDPSRPIVMGVLRGAASWPFPNRPGAVDVQADGERLVVTAKDQLVLQCGKASVTLTKAGKILLQGTYVSQRSSGTLRLRGGSVQIN